MAVVSVVVPVVLTWVGSVSSADTEEHTRRQDRRRGLPAARTGRDALMITVGFRRRTAGTSSVEGGSGGTQLREDDRSVIVSPCLRAARPEEHPNTVVSLETSTT